MAHQYYLCRTVLSYTTLNRSFERLAYVLYLLLQIIWSLGIVVGSMLTSVILNSKTTKACSYDFDVMIRVVGTKAVEAQGHERAVVFNKARVSSNHEDQQRSID